MDATVTMQLPEFQAMLEEKKTSADRIAALRTEVAEAKLGDADSLVRAMLKTTRAAVQIARFAMANLSPEFTKSWPIHELKFLGASMATLPDATSDDEDLGREMIAYARECQVAYSKANRATEPETADIAEE